MIDIHRDSCLFHITKREVSRLRKFFSRAALAIVFLAMIGVGPFAQNRTRLTIDCDTVGAQVLVNGRPMGVTRPQLVLQLPPGTYTLTVRHKNFPAFDTRVSLGAAPSVVQVRLAGAAGGGTIRPLPQQGPALQPLPASPQPAPAVSSVPASNMDSGRSTPDSYPVVGKGPMEGMVGPLEYVPAGRFQRDGSRANISTVGAFWMSRYEITREQFASLLGADPSDASHSQGGSDPVQKVNWYHAIAYCNKLSLAEGLTPVYTVIVNNRPIDWNTVAFAQIPTSNNLDWNGARADREADGYRLPTEMEWMWAAMGAPADGQNGGTNTIGYQKSYAGAKGSDSLDASIWHKGNSGGSTHPVGAKQPNELGLYDLSGNVKEWCWDWYAEALPQGLLTDYQGPSSGKYRVNHGGSVALAAQYASIASRNANHPYLMSNNSGIRLVRSLKAAVVSVPEKQSADQSPVPVILTYQAGDTGPAGGLIFFADSGNRYPDFDYLEAAPDWSMAESKSGEGSGWFGPQRNYVAGSSAKGLGAGEMNTAALVASFAGDGKQFAANFCADFVINGFDDWYLPSLDELVLMREALYKKNLGGFRTAPYWSSTEYDAGQAYFVKFEKNYSAANDYIGRTNNWFIRPVRKFKQAQSSQAMPPAPDAVSPATSTPAASVSTATPVASVPVVSSWPSAPPEGAETLSFAPASEQSYSLPRPASGFSASTTAIAVPGSLGPLSSIAAVRDQSGNAHLLYEDWKDDRTVTLRYLRQRGNGWESAVIDTIGKLEDHPGYQEVDNPSHKPAVALGPAGKIHFIWLGTSGGKTSLYHGALNPSSGVFVKTMVDTITPNKSAYQMGLGVDANSVVHISYYNKGLAYAKNTSGRFLPRTLAADISDERDIVEKGLNSDLVILTSGTIYVASHGIHQRNKALAAEFLDCQVYEGGSWRNTGVAGRMGTSNGSVLNLGVDNSGRPLVCYYAGGILGTAFYQDRAWHVKTVGAGTDMAKSMTAAVGSGGQVMVAWFSNRGDVLYLSRQSGGDWTHTPLYELGALRSPKTDIENFPQILPRHDGKAEIYLSAKSGTGGAILRISER